MANQKPLKRLKQGVAQWHKWREQYPKIQPDLSEATLSTATLCDCRAASRSRPGAGGVTASSQSPARIVAGRSW